MHKNTGEVCTRYPQYQTVFAVILDPKRNGEILGIEAASGGHRVAFREIGTRGYETVKLANDPETLAEAIKSVKKKLPIKRDVAPRESNPRARRGALPRTTFVPAGVSAPA